MGGSLRVSLLGGVEVWRGDERIPVAGTKLQALVALLALGFPRAVSADRLVEEIWGDAPPGNPTNALQAQVSQLRRLLGADAVPRAGSGYSLYLSADAVDAHVLERLVDEGRSAARSGELATASSRFAAAVALGRGAPLQDLVDLPFALEAAARLQELLLAAHEGDVDAKLASGGHAEVIEPLHALVATHPLRERFHAQLMTALYRSGRQAEALAVYERVRGLLAEELGLDPGPELRALERAVLTQDPGLAAPIPLSTDRTATHVPVPLTSFVGRDAELDQLAGVLAQHRLVTIVGPGGVGKSRLALEHLSRRSEGHESWFVELAPVTDAVALPETIAAAVGAQDRSTSEGPGASRPPSQRTIERIGSRQVTVVLDNCEHVAEAAAHAAATLLASCPALTVLATSREPLGLSGEVQVPLLPLTEGDAAALFRQRAQAVQPAFGDGEDTDHLLELCRRLDHLPLAIELAAARTKSLGLAEIADRLDDRFDLLRRSGRDGEARHQGLRAAIDWSYEMLFDDERRAFCRLALFAGGATVESAQAVCGEDALDIIERLVDRSLLIPDASPGHRRFRMLESLRAYGQARLEETGDLDEGRRAYLDWALALARQAEVAARGADQVRWLDRLDDEHDNLRDALHHAVTSAPDDALRLIGALLLPWYLRGRRQEGRHWAEACLDAAPDDAAADDLAKALAWCGFIAESSGWTGTPGGIEQELELAEARQRRALELAATSSDAALVADLRMLLLVTMTRRAVAGIDFRGPDIAELTATATRAYAALGDDYGASLVCIMQAIVAIGGSFLHDAAIAIETARTHTRRTGERFSSSRVEWMLGMLADVGGDPASAYRHTERSLRLLDELGMAQAVTAQAALLASLAERTGQPELAAQWRAYLGARAPHAANDDVLTMANTRNAEGHAARLRGDLDRARAAHLEALAVYRDANMSGGTALTQSSLGFLASEAGDPGAGGHHLAALEAAMTANEPASLALAVEGIASLLVGIDAEGAALLLGAAASLRAEAAPVLTTHREDVAACTQAAIDVLGSAAHEAAFARGRRLARAEAVASALAAAPRVTAS